MEALQCGWLEKVIQQRQFTGRVARHLYIRPCQGVSSELELTSGVWMDEGKRG